MKGLYSEICHHNGVKPKNFSDVKSEIGSEAARHGFVYACKKLLEVKQGKLKPVYDAILIDEGQDLVGPVAYKYEDKQPFYWMAYTSIKAEEGRLPLMTWAYDELQDLNTLTIPTYRELFGDSADVQKLTRGRVYVGNVNKSEVMKKCYRTPYQILVAAHALGMGIFRKQGVLSCFTDKDEWQAVGYNVVEGAFNKNGLVKIERPKENNLNTIEQHMTKDLIEVSNYHSKEVMYEALARCIASDIREEKLMPSRDILVVNLDYPSSIERIIAALNRNGVNGYVPKMPSLNQVEAHFTELVNDRFWQFNGVTVSNIIDAKGNEAPMVYVVGVENALKETDRASEEIKKRNELFVGMTRAKCWIHLMGVQLSMQLMEEMEKAIGCKGTFAFDYKRPPRVIDQEQVGN